MLERRGIDPLVDDDDAQMILEVISHSGAGRDDGDSEVAQLGPGDLLGEVALLTDGVRTATAVAADECQIYRVASADIQYILANNMELATHLKKLVAERLGR